MPKGHPGTKAPHGTPARYQGWDCRCDACRIAWNDYARARRGGMRVYERLAAIAPEHGTESKYVHHGCRCDRCKSAAAEARQLRRRNPNPSLHGLRSSYANGCRCDECREANTIYFHERRDDQRA